MALNSSVSSSPLYGSIDENRAALGRLDEDSDKSLSRVKLQRSSFMAINDSHDPKQRFPSAVAPKPAIRLRINKPGESQIRQNSEGPQLAASSGHNLSSPGVSGFASARLTQSRAKNSPSSPIQSVQSSQLVTQQTRRSSESSICTQTTKRITTTTTTTNIVSSAISAANRNRSSAKAGRSSSIQIASSFYELSQPVAHSLVKPNSRATISSRPKSIAADGSNPLSSDDNFNRLSQLIVVNCSEPKTPIRRISLSKEKTDVIVPQRPEDHRFALHNCVATPLVLLQPWRVESPEAQTLAPTKLIKSSSPAFLAESQTRKPQVPTRAIITNTPSGSLTIKRETDSLARKTAINMPSVTQQSNFALQSTAPKLPDNQEPSNTDNSQQEEAKYDTIRKRPASLLPTEMLPVAEQMMLGSSSSNKSVAMPKQDTGSSIAEQQTNQEDLPTRPYPKKVFFIVGNEFCERFSYYGLRTLLVLYFKNVLSYSESKSTIFFHLFVTLCYLTPIFGAILGDSIWGKYHTILGLSVVYFIGELFLVVSSIFWLNSSISQATVIIGLVLIGIGTGGIKPCVGALGGDQFYPNEERQRQTFFSLFYAAINLGSLISTFLTPILRSNISCVGRTDCYPAAFGVPCLLMLLSMVVFLLAKNQYYLSPLPERNVIVAFIQCIWLALKRKLSGKTVIQIRAEPATLESSQALNHGPESITTSRSSLTNSVVGEESPVLQKGNQNPNKVSISKPDSSTPLSADAQLWSSARNRGSVSTLQTNTEQELTSKKESHWLELASDKFDAKSIRDFRSVLNIFLIFLPIPVYWCLFDQQSSLWTLQAARMDGRLFGSSVIIQPDQMSVANPLMLLLAIPLFDTIIYPFCERHKILTKPIQRMTIGGLIAAFAFLAAGLIEIKIKEYSPSVHPLSGQSNLILINGINGCHLDNPTFSYMLTFKSKETQYEILHRNNARSIAEYGSNQLVIQPNENMDRLYSGQSNQLITRHMKPLGVATVEIPSNDISSNLSLNFNIGNVIQNRRPGPERMNTCPLDPSLSYQIQVGPMNDKSVKLLYLEQGNGKLSYKLFNESLSLPKPGKARVRLIYEFFGSPSEAKKHKFYLKPSTISQNLSLGQQFEMGSPDGQVIPSEYIDIDIPESGQRIKLSCKDSPFADECENYSLELEPGTRNLIVIHQNSATDIEFSYHVIQDNKYRISILYQLIPYFLISLSEVMLSITGLQFSYSMAPESMKSVILGAWCLTTAFGNILTVVIESLQLFSDVAIDFLFYAVIMALDMALLAVIGFNFTPFLNNQ